MYYQVVLGQYSTLHMCDDVKEAVKIQMSTFNLN